MCSDFGTIEEIRKERVMDLVVFAQLRGVRKRGYFQTALPRMLQPSEQFGIAE